MKKWLALGGIGLAILFLLAFFTGAFSEWLRRDALRQTGQPIGSAPARVTPPPGKPGGIPGAPAKSPLPATGDDRVARAEKIRRDYDEMTAKFSADYSAAGTSFPGGLNAYLRQLALLQREKHNDLAALLSPRELEDLEMRDTNAGQTVARLLGDTTATDEQRRAVFRLQVEFENQYALTFDLTPAALYAREAARQALQQKIRGVLGDELFGSWLRGEGSDYAAMQAFVQQQGFANSLALDLWKAKSDFVLARIQLKARPDITAAQLVDAERNLIAQTRTRVTGLIGPAAAAGPGREVLTWLPPSK